VLMPDVGHFPMQGTPEESNQHLRPVIVELETG
jgi:hypothetical protein